MPGDVVVWVVCEVCVWVRMAKERNEEVVFRNFQSLAEIDLVNN